MHHIFFIQSPAVGHLGCFHVLAIVNSTTMNTEVQISFQMIVFAWYMPRSGISGSYGNSIFSFWINLYTVLHSNCTNLQSYQQCMRAPFVPHPIRDLLSVNFVMMVILTDVKNWLSGKDPDAEKDWRQEEKGTTEDEMVGWHHQLDGHGFEQAPGVGEGPRSLAVHGVSKSQTRLSDWTE